MATRPLTCQELVEIVTDYLEDALPPAERERFERHLAVCDGCTAYMAQMKQTIEAVGRIDEEAIPPQVMDRLLEAFRTWKRTGA